MLRVMQQDVMKENHQRRNTLTTDNETATANENLDDTVSDINNVQVEHVPANEKYEINLKITIPSATDRYFISNYDVSVAFYAFQVASLNNFDTHNIESNVSNILSLSSILLVQNKKWSPDLIGIFTEEKLIEIYDDQAKRFQTGRYKKRKVVGADIIADIVKDINSGLITRTDGMAKVYILLLRSSSSNLEDPPHIPTIINVPPRHSIDSSSSSSRVVLPSQKTSSSSQQQAPQIPSLLPLNNLNKLIKCAAKLIEKLPTHPLKDQIQEVELCQRFIDPILSGMFDDPEHDILFR
ncbi:hypothetical protein INT45_005492, partial [Circinella minor]